MTAFLYAQRSAKNTKMAEKPHTQRNEVTKIMAEVTNTQTQATEPTTEPAKNQTTEPTTEPKAPTYEELVAQLAAEKASGIKNKQALDKALKEKGEITKALRAKQTAEEQEQEAKAEAERLQNEKYENAVKELNHMKAMAAYKDISEKSVELLIEAVEEKDHASIATIFANELKAAVTAAKAEWMKSRPAVNAGAYSSMTKEQIMAIPDRNERLKAIAMNPTLF